MRPAYSSRICVQVLNTGSVATPPNASLLRQLFYRVLTILAVGQRTLLGGCFHCSDITP
jgi:hypothetical protein